MKIRKFILFVIAVCVLNAARIDPDRYLAHIKYLASEELKGRGTGTAGLDKAAAYIARQYRALGLKPAGDKGYFQAFEVTTSARLGSGNHFSYAHGAGSAKLKLQEDFVPMNFSSAGKVSGQLVFAGYGITAPEYRYDDYAGIDVKGKVVLLLRHEPQEFDDNSVFAGKIFTNHAQFASKAVNAKFHGARAVILVNDRHNHSADADTLQKFSGVVGPAGAGIPYLQIKGELAERWLKQADRSLDDVAKAIDQDLQPRSFALPVHVDLNVDIQLKSRTIQNVAAYLEGDAPEYLIVGAHYDHLGLGEQYSMAPSETGKSHYGADDNASGTAGLLELARWFSSRPKPKRGILFLAFAAEELGLLGSVHYVDHPELPLEKAVAMINLDMIGRVRDGRVYIGGVATGSNFRALLEPLAEKSSLNIEFNDAGGYGSSDHFSFTPKDIPILFFFSGLHEDYHKPTDTWDKINAPGAAQILEVVASLGDELLEEADRPQFVRLNPPEVHGELAGSSAASGYGPYFGSVPDMVSSADGVRFADVRAGSPAEAAGLKPGDVLIEFEGKPIQNLYDFTYALRGKQPGDAVPVTVLRNADRVYATVTLRERK